MLSYLSISTLSIVELCDELSDELSATMKEKDIYGQAISIKIKSHDFKLKTKVGNEKIYVDEICICN